MQYQTLLYFFEQKMTTVDETSFYFRKDTCQKEHVIGYLPQNTLPYWVGDCDLEGGCVFQTAKEMFEAPIFDGKSIKDRWDEIEIAAIGGVDVDSWTEAIGYPKSMSSRNDKGICL